MISDVTVQKVFNTWTHLHHSLKSLKKNVSGTSVCFSFLRRLQCNEQEFVVHFKFSSRFCNVWINSLLSKEIVEYRDIERKYRGNKVCL